MQRVWILVVLAVVAFLAWESLRSAGKGTGDTAPSFAAESTDGNWVDVAAYKGRSAVLLNFFSVH
jgi:hypothetical protein